ncbi:MAG: chemotaxis protein CheD [Candidatus Magnetominusculus sp. LBB02]|nr:chemotaxis protein CheD [Candidatus Magnetominusculus sp. LBB02]
MKEHFLYPGTLYADKEPSAVTTILGSCVGVCFWDEILKIGGINHYLLPLWNGEGLPSPKYGNIAITKLLEKMLSLGSQKRNLKAKVFGGAALMAQSSGLLNVGERNILIAEDVLAEEGIKIISSDVGGNEGRKMIFRSDTGGVMLKKIVKTVLKGK